MSGIGWRIEAFRAFLMRRDPFITRETANSSQLQWFYSNAKIKKEIGIEFISVKESVEKVAKLFLKQHA
jgi:hypothetical protein